MPEPMIGDRQPGEGRPIVLVDMDGVLVDLEAALLVQAEAVHGPGLRYTAPHLRGGGSFRRAMDGQVSREWVEEVLMTQGTYRDAPPVEGAIAGMADLAALGVELVICSKHKLGLWSAGEKVDWVSRHLPGLEDRMVMTRDKTLVRGDVLIDDKARVTGMLAPEWVHLQLLAGATGRDPYGWTTIAEGVKQTLHL
ncbi:hypothetical protein BH23ACT9_BH23ACT9_02730 [soil metagenome]